MNRHRHNFVFGAFFSSAEVMDGHPRSVNSRRNCVTTAEGTTQFHRPQPER